MLYHQFDFSDSANFLALGKTYTKENALVLPWNDSGFSFHFYGTGFVLHFGAYPCPEVPYVRVWVDGRPSQRFAVTNGTEKILIDGLCEGAHTAKILRVTEGMDPIIVKSVAITGLEPKLLNKPAERPLRLAFIGDSITCGYGVVGASTTAAGFLPFVCISHSRAVGRRDSAVRCIGQRYCRQLQRRPHRYDIASGVCIQGQTGRRVGSQRLDSRPDGYQRRHQRCVGRSIGRRIYRNRSAFDAGSPRSVPRQTDHLVLRRHGSNQNGRSRSRSQRI